MAYNNPVSRSYISFGRTFHVGRSPVDNTGLMVSFYYDAVYNRVMAPEDYVTADAENILDSFESETYADNVTVIAILNESWSDFSHMGQLDTGGIDYLGDWRSRTENVIKGYATISVYGGMTCNSEYEFLTGNSMYFLNNAGVFTNYLNSKNDSIVTYLSDQGFNTTSYAPCEKALWDIGKAYPNLGFGKSYYLNDMNMNQDDCAVTGHMSDDKLFDRLIKLVDSGDKNRPSFYYTTTMQNHAPYHFKYNPHLKLTSPANGEAESYLNLVYESDKAFSKLVEHYKNSDRHVVIVMFGDHYPHIDGVYEDLRGEDYTDSIEEYSKLYQTPFIIWSNQSIESKWIDDISLNYLSNEVFKAAGIPLSPVQQELEHIREYFPIIAGFGYKTKDGEWFEKGNSCEYDDILHEYHVLQWYRMFDKKRRILTSSGH